MLNDKSHRDSRKPHPYFVYYDFPDEILEDMTFAGHALSPLQRMLVCNLLDIGRICGDPELAILCCCFGKSAAHVYENDWERDEARGYPCVELPTDAAMKYGFEKRIGPVSLIEILEERDRDHVFRVRNSAYMLADRIELECLRLGMLPRPLPGTFGDVILSSYSAEYRVPLIADGRSRRSEICQLGRPSAAAFRPILSFATNDEAQRRLEMYEKGWSEERGERLRVALRDMGLVVRNAQTGLPEVPVARDSGPVVEAEGGQGHAVQEKNPPVPLPSPRSRKASSSYQLRFNPPLSAWGEITFFKDNDVETEFSGIRRKTGEKFTLSTEHAGLTDRKGGLNAQGKLLARIIETGCVEEITSGATLSRNDKARLAAAYGESEDDTPPPYSMKRRVDPALKKQVERLRKVLKDVFGLDTDPIPHTLPMVQKAIKGGKTGKDIPPNYEHHYQIQFRTN